MIEFEKPIIKNVDRSEDNTYGKYTVEPLERGYGTTLGNSLRRIMLSSLPGVAITSVKINDVRHEFSTIEGIREDVIEILLNLKGLCAKMYTDEPQIIRIEAQGEGEITAADIICGPEVEIINPDMHICTMANDAVLNMEMKLEKGRFYRPS